MTSHSLVQKRRGKSRSYLLDGHPVPGVTTVLDVLDKPALRGWAARVCAEGAANRWDELAALPISERITTIKGLPWKDRDEAANQGTRVHGLAAQLADGQQVNVPDELAGHVAACVRYLDDTGLEPLAIERPVAHTGYGYAGTFDLLARIGGRTVLLDWKTNRSGPFPETSLQLAAYAHATHWLIGETTELSPFNVPINERWVVWLRPDGTYETRTTDISDDSFDVFCHLLAVWRLWISTDPQNRLAVAEAAS